MKSKSLKSYNTTARGGGVAQRPGLIRQKNIFSHSDLKLCFKWFNDKTPMLIFLTIQNKEHDFELLSKLHINQKLLDIEKYIFL